MCERVLNSCLSSCLGPRRSALPGTWMVYVSALHESIGPCVLFIMGFVCAGAQSLPLRCCQEAVSEGQRARAKKTVWWMVVL